MQITVSLTIDLPASGNIDSVEPILLDAARRMMIQALTDCDGTYAGPTA